jgi:ubiquitin C-terminal hydrolase
LGETINWGVFEESEKKVDQIQMCIGLIDLLNDMIESKRLEKKIEKSMTISGLVGLLCLMTPLSKDLKQEERVYWIQKKEKSIDALLNDEASQFKSFVIKGLMNSNIAIVRFCFRNFYSFLLDNLTNLKHKSEFLKLLIKTILANEDEDVHLLIELAGNLFSEIMELKKKDSSTTESLDIDFNQLFWQFFNKFEGHVSREKNFGDPIDYTLVSSLAFMEKILKTDPEILKMMNPDQKKELSLNLLQKCLFKVDSESIEYDQLKCKSNSSREAALNLLACLSKNDIKTSILVFIKGLSALADHIPSPQTSSRSYSMLLEFEKKSSLGFLGIKNLGCICYMIAMLQQFFCTETFTRGVLMANDYVDVEMTEVKGRMVDDNVFHQLQNMFGFLQNSHRREYNPLEFCLSYKDFGGQPVNISLQQDAQEFLNCIFDRLERSLKKTPFKGILDSVYSGKKINLIECKGCGYVRSNTEIFYNLSLEIKGLKNMEESFKKFIEPETISDFLCDNCKKKCDISKGSYLETVPNVLIVHLKKMIFDLDFMANIKIGTRYEFPKKLNLKEYIVSDSKLQSKKKEDSQETQPFDEGEPEEKASVPKTELKDEDFEYKLVGVVIHKGTAEWGHYVSLIDANRGKDDEKWLLFDDGHVSDFKMENFEEECFGSSSTSNREEYGHSLYEMADTFSGASKSAYILIYDKVKKSKLHFEFTEENIKEKEFIINNLINKEDYKFENNVLETGFYNLGKYVPPAIKQKITKDNKQFILEQQLYSSNFLGFFSEVIVNSGIPIVMIDFLDGYYNLNLDPFDNEGYRTDSQGNVPVLPKLSPHQNVMIEILGKALPKYYFSLYCNSNELYKLQAVEKMLERVFILKPTKAWEFFCFYFKENISRVFHLVISNTETIIRTSVAETIASCLQVVTKYFNINLLKEDERMNDPEKLIKEVLEKYLNVLNHMENANSYKKLPQYFYLLFRALQKNYKLQDFLIEKQYLNDLYEFYMSKVETKTYSKEAHERALNYLLGILSLLLKRLKNKYFNDENHGKFYQNLFMNLLDINFYKKLLKEDYHFSNFEFVRRLVCLGCEDNELVSLKVISVSLEGLQTSGTNDVLSYMESVKALLMIRDKIMLLRIRCIFGVPRLEETRVKVNNRPFYLFGMSKENNLHKSVYSFMSPVFKQKSVTQMMLDKKDHFREWVSVMLCTLTNIIYNNDSVLYYLLSLPSPNYYAGNCLDWIWKFAKIVDSGHNISYSIMRQEIQYFYLRNFKDKINDFIVFVRNKLGLTRTPELILFEEDHEVDCSHYVTNGQTFKLTDEQDPRAIESVVLRPLRDKFDQFLDFVARAKRREIKRLYVDSQTLEEEKKKGESVEEGEVEEGKPQPDEEEGRAKTRIPMAPPLKSVTENTQHEDPRFMTNEEKKARLDDFKKVVFCNNSFDMVGRSLKVLNIQRIPLYSIEETGYSGEKSLQNLGIKVDIVRVLTRESLPIGKEGNLNIPKNCIHNSYYLKGNATMKDKAFSFFVRNGSEEEDEKLDMSEVQPYFHDIPDPKRKGKGDYSGVGNDYQVDFSKKGETEIREEKGSNDQDNQNKDNSCNDNPSKEDQPENNTDKKSSDNFLKHPANRVESIIRIAVANKTEQNFMVKFEFNKIEDIDFTKQILNRGYYESDNQAELVWSDNDAYSEDDTQDEENYHKRVRKNHRGAGCKVFRKQKNIARVKEALNKNYVVSDTLKGVSMRKKDMPVTYIRKRNPKLPFGDIVVKVSWVKTDKIGIKSLERNFKSNWDWKLIRLQLRD